MSDDTTTQEALGESQEIVAELKAEIARLRDTIANDIDAYCRPRCDDEYNCCGCSTYYSIVDDAVRIARGESVDDPGA